MLQREAISEPALIVGRIRLGTGVAQQCDQFGFVNCSSNENRNWWGGAGPLGFGVGLRNGCSQQQT